MKEETIWSFFFFSIEGDEDPSMKQEDAYLRLMALS